VERRRDEHVRVSDVLLQLCNESKRRSLCANVTWRSAQRLIFS
jgi:hypothetical protein